MPGSSGGEKQGDSEAARLLDCKETGLKAQCQEMALGTFIPGKRPGSCCWWDIPHGHRQESSTRVLRHSRSRGDTVGHKHSARGSS